MATKRMKVKPMLMGIVTTVFISFGFSACTANEDNPSTPEQQPQQDYSAFEAYGLTYHNFDGTDDVKILNADTTKIAVKKSLADKLGIKTFVNHPIGIWDAPSHLAFGRKAVEEQLEGDTYILTVTKVTVAELIGDKVAQLSTDIYVNKNFKGSSDLSAKYTDDDGKIHPAVVQMTDPYGYDKGYHLEGDKHSTRQLEAIEKGEYEYQTAEDLFAKRPNGSWSMRIISMHDKIEFDHDIPLGKDSGDSINIAGEIPIDFELNYFLTFDPEVYWEHWWTVIPDLIVRKFETGIEGEFGFHPSATIGFKKQIKLPEDKGKVKLASFNGFSFSFMVGPVPVTVVVQPGIYLQIDASASGAVQFGFAYNYANSFKAGIRYDYGKGWKNISNYEVTENEFDFILPEIDFKAEAGIAIFMAAAAKIYDVAGPELGIGPRLGAEAELTISPDGVDYKQEVNMRLQAWAGAKIEVLGYELAEWSTRFDLAGPWTILKYPEE